MREGARCRREAEDDAQREQRLTEMREEAREAEDDAEREQKLTEMREEARCRREAEDDAQREQRLTEMREYDAGRQNSETDAQREQRLRRRRDYDISRRNSETDEKQQQRLLRLKESARRSTVENYTMVASLELAKRRYLHEDGWKNQTQPLHKQKWVEANMRSFHVKQQKWHQKQCNICHETWPTRVNSSEFVYICIRCKRDKHEVKLFSADNDMNPGEVPPSLEGLTQVEEMLIARAHPIMSVYHRKGGQRGYSGHAINLPQDIQGFLNELPCHISDLPLLVIWQQGSNDTRKDWIVRRDRVLAALLWLRDNNKFYKDIEIDDIALHSLQVNGVPPELLTIEVKEEVGSSTHNESGPQCDSDDGELQPTHVDLHALLPIPQPERLEDDTIRAAVNDEDPLDWPTVSGQPINEFQTEELCSIAFPTLFPYGKGNYKHIVIL